MRDRYPSRLLLHWSARAYGAALIITFLAPHSSDVLAAEPQTIQFSGSGEPQPSQLDKLRSKRTDSFGTGAAPTRRTLRRPGTARGKAAASYGPNCTQVLDADGRVSARCF